MEEKTVWNSDEPLPPADIIMNDPSCLGILGITLRQALSDLQQGSVRRLDDASVDNSVDDACSTADEEKAIHNSRAEDDNEKPASTKLTTEMVDRVMKSLGEAVVQQQKECFATAPAALLRGRVNHFNRRNSKWRIVVDDGEMRRRRQLDQHRKLRRTERPSLWDVATRKNEKDRELPHKIGTIELLAYNDT
jgi:hypothetical protein